MALGAVFHARARAHDVRMGNPLPLRRGYGGGRRRTCREDGGDFRRAVLSRINSAFYSIEAGDGARAVRVLRELIRAIDRMGIIVLRFPAFATIFRSARPRKHRRIDGS